MIHYTNLDEDDPFTLALNVSACESLLWLLDDLGVDTAAGGFRAGHDLLDPASRPGAVDAATAHAWARLLDAALEEDLVVDVVHRGAWGADERATMRVVGPQVRRPLPHGSEVRGLDAEAEDWLRGVIDFLFMCEGFRWE